MRSGISYWSRRAVALSCLILLSGCAKTPAIELLYGERGFGTQLLQQEEPLPKPAAGSLLGAPFYLGGRGGSLGVARVDGIEPTGCQESEYVLALQPSPPLQLYVGYARPAHFLTLARWPTAREALAAIIPPAIGVSTEETEVIIDQVWRLAVPDSATRYLVVVAHSPRDPELGAVGDPGDFDALLLLEEVDEGWQLRDQRLWAVTDPGGWRVFPQPFAAALNPFNNRLELFVRYLYYEGESIDGFDLTNARLEARYRSECSI